MNGPLVVGWTLLLVLVAVGAPLSEGLVGRFGGRNDVLLRPWMVTSGSAVALAHFVALALVAFGARRRRLPAAFFAGAALLVLGQVAAPHVLGSGPHAYGSMAVATLSVLVYMALVLRGLGWLALAVPAQHGVAACAAIDLVITVMLLMYRPVAVMPRLHATIGWSPLLLPFLAGGALLLLRTKPSKTEV